MVGKQLQLRLASLTCDWSQWENQQEQEQEQDVKGKEEKYKAPKSFISIHINIFIPLWRINHYNLPFQAYYCGKSRSQPHHPSC